MMINETSQKTNLTKKAIEYYTEQDLIFPDVLDNGYRNFNDKDIERLKKISVLRKLGLSIGEIKAVIDEENDNNLQKLSVQKELKLQRDCTKKAILDKLFCDKNYDAITTDIEAIEQSTTVTEKILDAFPGYYGRFICLHFARFLNEPMISDEQQSAYKDILIFLDNCPSLSFPKEVQAYMIECTNHISTIDIKNIIDNTKQSIEDPDKFLAENKDFLEQYLAFKQSDEYINTPMYQIQSLLLEFNNSSGYYDKFIPAMKKLSPSYSEYCKHMEIANEKLLAKYPEIEKLNNYAK